MKKNKLLVLIILFFILDSCNSNYKKTDSVNSDSIANINEIIKKVKAEDSIKNALAIDSIKKTKDKDFQFFSKNYFIGKTKKEIKSSWSTTVSDECFQEGNWSDTNEPFFIINCDGSVFPYFTSTFDKLGKCKGFSIKVSAHNISVYRAVLIKIGYIPTKNGFVNKDKTENWKFKPNVLSQNGQTTEDYFLECVKTKR